MTQDLLVKYLKNNCSDSEFDEFADWVKADSDTKEARNWSFDQWKSIELDPKKKDKAKYQSLLYKIHYEINLKQRNDKSSKEIVLPKAIKWLSRVAAILFIPLLGVVFYMLSNGGNFQMNKYADQVVDSLEIIAPIGSRTIVHLSDGTDVNLNYGSKIKYPRYFGKTREVSLSGEGYFDVSHNPDKPFIVRAGKLNVKAVGTKFNVCTYSGDNRIETTLVEGKVILEKTIQGEKSQSVETMVPGQHVSYDVVSGKISSTIGRTDKYVAWKDGKLVFDNTPMTEIAEKLSRMFNVKIEVADNAKDLSYTVTFGDDSLNLILDLMTETAPVKYTFLPREKQADGTFSKQEIRIEKR